MKVQTAREHFHDVTRPICDGLTDRNRLSGKDLALLYILGNIWAPQSSELYMF